MTHVYTAAGHFIIGDDMTHTPGPWTVITGAVYTPNGTPIAMMDRESGNGTRPVERDANAKLIAAAPALLSALEGVTLTAADPLSPHDGRLEAAIKQARAAIEAAKGDA